MSGYVASETMRLSVIFKSINVRTRFPIATFKYNQRLEI